MTVPKALSLGQEALALHCRAYKILLVPEYRFDKVRRWRFDFAIPAKNLAIEIEGGSWVNGRHNRGSGMEKDCKKYNAAVLQGWHILRFTTAMVISGEAIEVILRFLRAAAVRKGDGMSDFVILEKPKFHDPCNRCGWCCREAACELSELYLHSTAAPCIALEIEPDGQTSCGLLKRPSFHLGLKFNADEEIRALLSPMWKGRCCAQTEAEVAANGFGVPA